MRLLKSEMMIKILIAALLLCTAGFVFTGCSRAKKQVKVLILPHFETGDIKGDDAGEAQLFYAHYLDGADEYELANGGTLYYNKANKVALALTGQGKTAAAANVSCVLSDTRFDFSQAYILAAGCAGGNMFTCTLGAVCIESEVVDMDLGHTIDARDLEDLETESEWFHDEFFDGSAHFIFNESLVDRAYELTKDLKLTTTERAKATLKHNYPKMPRAEADPEVLKGTSVTSDNYWKGYYSHERANSIVTYYGCRNHYVSSEMEDVAIAYVAANYGLLDRTIILRGIVNTDSFLEGDNALTLWDGQGNALTDNVFLNSESLDIFEPCMHNLEDVGSRIIDDWLNQ